MWRRRAKASGGSSPATPCWPSSTPSDNAESKYHQSRSSVPFAESTRGYPVLGINLRTLFLAPLAEMRLLFGRLREVGTVVLDQDQVASFLPVFDEAGAFQRPDYLPPSQRR